MSDKFQKEYLGDGVYASFDGYQVWLHVNHHEAPPVVALEPPVIDALCRYFARMTMPHKTADGELDRAGKGD